MRRRTVLPVLLLLLSACGGGPDPEASPTTEAATDPLLGAPEAGDCRVLDKDEIGSDPSVVESYVPCDQEHTARILAVQALPDDVSLDADIQQLIDVVRPDCTVGATTYVGGTKDLQLSSLFALYFFTPTKQDQEAGAAWVGCEVAALDDEEALVLPEAYPYLDPPAGDTQPVSRFRTCVKVADDDTTTKVGCAKDHTLESANILVATDEGDLSGDQLDRCRREAPPDAAVVGHEAAKQSAFDAEPLYAVVCLQYDLLEGTRG